MNVSEHGLELIKRHEGLRLMSYRCPSGVWTIGYGHTDCVRRGQAITEEQAMEYLRSDVKVSEACLNSLPDLRLRQCQFDSLCSFIFNVGCGAFLRSTLLRKARSNPDDPSIRDEFMKYVKSSGRVLQGLVRRRQEEAQLYFGHIDEHVC